MNSREFAEHLCTHAVVMNEQGIVFIPPCEWLDFIEPLHITNEQHFEVMVATDGYIAFPIYKVFHLTNWEGSMLVQYVKKRLLPQKKQPTILDLSLSYHWYDMIASGHKKEEYREIKPFYKKRMLACDYKRTGYCVPYSCTADCPFISFRKYDFIRFHRGQGSSTTMLVECKGISIGHGKPEWGVNPADVMFVIKLGKIIGK